MNKYFVFSVIFYNFYINFKNENINGIKIVLIDKFDIQ